MDIPGFYYDPKTNRHYRKVADRKFPSSHEDPGPSSESSVIQRRKIPIINFSKLLYSRECGTLSERMFTREYLQKLVVASVHTIGSNPKILYTYHSCDLSACGNWVFASNSHTIYGVFSETLLLKLKWNSVSEFETKEIEIVHFLGRQVMDICMVGESSSETLTVMCGVIQPEYGRSYHISLQYCKVPRVSRDNYIRVEKEVLAVAPLDKLRAVFGGEDYFSVIILEGCRLGRTQQVSGCVKTLAASSCGNLIACGCRSGQMEVCDLRSDNGNALKWQVKGNTFVSGLCFLPTIDSQVAVYTAGSVPIYDLRTPGRVLQTLVAEGPPGCHFKSALTCIKLEEPWVRGGLDGVRYDAGECVLSASGIDGTVRVWLPHKSDLPVLAIPRENFMVGQKLPMSNVASDVPWSTFRSTWPGGGPPGVLAWLRKQPITFTSAFNKIID